MGVMRQNAAWIVIVVVVVEDVMSGCREACTELHGGRGKALGAKRTRGSLTRCWDGAWPTQVCVSLLHKHCPALAVSAKRNIRLPD